jgi:hypothetical protein
MGVFLGFRTWILLVVLLVLALGSRMTQGRARCGDAIATWIYIKRWRQCKRAVIFSDFFPDPNFDYRTSSSLQVANYHVFAQSNSKVVLVAPSARKRGFEVRRLFSTSLCCFYHTECIHSLRDCKSSRYCRNVDECLGIMAPAGIS